MNALAAEARALNARMDAINAEMSAAIAEARSMTRHLSQWNDPAFECQLLKGSTDER